MKKTLTEELWSLVSDYLKHLCEESDGDDSLDICYDKHSEYSWIFVGKDEEVKSLDSRPRGACDIEENSTTEMIENFPSTAIEIKEGFGIRNMGDYSFDIETQKFYKRILGKFYHYGYDGEWLMMFWD